MQQVRFDPGARADGYVHIHVSGNHFGDIGGEGVIGIVPRKPRFGKVCALDRKASVRALITKLASECDVVEQARNVKQFRVVSMAFQLGEKIPEVPAAQAVVVQARGVMLRHKPFGVPRQRGIRRSAFACQRAGIDPS
ncbi:Uncharacterised protein [Mycobacteroides abscessus subsp. abscessus]|nr:Uncharacterised protein [Mycobacteroides abscessus subsp. abscessus]